MENQLKKGATFVVKDTTYTVVKVAKGILLQAKKNDKKYLYMLNDRGIIDKAISIGLIKIAG